MSSHCMAEMRYVKFKGEHANYVSPKNLDSKETEGQRSRLSISCVE